MDHLQTDIRVEVKIKNAAAAAANPNDARAGSRALRAVEEERRTE